ncbi:MAG TPA: hypothetical protein VH437_04455 [Terriglobales bacterium]|jgi:hypothetical protein
MPGESKNGMQCTEFDALLSDALDEILSTEKVESFRAHARVCAVCGPLWSEAQAGKHWLKSLEEVAPPANLVHNILAATTGREETRSTVRVLPVSSWKTTVREWIAPVIGVIRQPRFVMSFGMAFFSLSAALSVAGVNFRDLKQVDLRPSAVKRTYYEASGKVVKYYENIRLVYEIESRVRELKKATTPAEPGPQEQNRERKNNTSEQPEQKQERNYSQGETQLVLASVSDDPPVVHATTYRRFV